MAQAQLDERSSTPLYEQLRRQLQGQIDDGTFAPGARIPSEDRLNTLYGVSRITIRRALRELVDEGYLIKRPGKGTYVSDEPPAHAAPQKVSAKFVQDNDVESFTEACRANGMHAGAQLVACDTVGGFEDEREFFGFGAEGSLLRIERVRTADGIPIMVEENYFPAREFAFLQQADFEDTSLFDIVSAHGYGDPTLKEPCRLDLEKAAPAEAARLHVPVGEPLFCLYGRYYDESGAPLYLGKQHIVGTRYTFRI